MRRSTALHALRNGSALETLVFYNRTRRDCLSAIPRRSSWGVSFFVCAVEKFTGACYTYVNRIAKGREQIEGKTSVKLMDGLGYDVR